MVPEPAPRRRMARPRPRQSVETRQEATHAQMVSFPAPGHVAGGGCPAGRMRGTATTRVTITPPDQAPVCQPQAALKASVFWRTQWRADQKDVTEREAAAGQGITRFFAEAGCFASVEVARTEAGGSAFEVPAGADRLVVLTVRELGPTVKLLSSAALVEGGTEVVVDVAVYRPGAARAAAAVLDPLAGRRAGRGERRADAACGHGGGPEGRLAGALGRPRPLGAAATTPKRLFSGKYQQK